MPPVFAFLTDAKEAFTELVTGLLMVAGGFLVGYFLGAVVAWAVGRYVFKQQNTEMFKRVGRPVGGVILALIVALIVFTGRGKPHGEGGDGKGTPDTDPNAGKNPPSKIDTTPKPPDPNLKTPPDVKPADVVLQVTVYGGGGAQGDRRYQLNDDRTLLTIEDLKKAILARRAGEKGKVTIAILYPENPDHAPGNPKDGLHENVSKVVQWATSEAKLDVTFPAAR